MTIPPIVASYFTLAGFRPFDGPHGASPHDMRDRIEAAARAGYSGIGTDGADLIESVARHGHAGIKAMLADNGLGIFELEGIGDWFGPAAQANPMRRLFLEAAEKIGVSQIKVTGNILGRSQGRDVMRRDFATLRAEAANAGTNVTLEMVCISDIATIDAVCDVIAESPTGAALLDIWHFANGGVSYADIAKLPAGAIGWVELDDGLAHPQGSIISEQLDNRMLPGTGDFDTAGFLAAVRAAGYAGGVGVELLSEQMRTLPLAEAAQLSFNAARAALAGR